MPSTPTYRSPHVRYQIDGCEPQKQAIRSGKIEFHALTKGHYPGLPLPAGTLPGLRNLGFWNAANAQDWGLEPHRNEGIELMYLETGDMDFAVDQKDFRLAAGHFTVTRPWQLHRLGAPNIGPGRLHWLILDVGVRRPHQEWRWPKWLVLAPADMAELTRLLRHSEQPVWPAPPPVRRAFRELAQEVAGWGAPHGVSRLTVSLNQLFIGLLDALSAQPAREDERLTSRQRTVDIFLDDLRAGRIDLGETWTLERMAAHCGMGITAFSQYCRARVNTGPVKFLNRCRLEFAARRLRAEPGVSITEIALTSGFNSSQYFATAFARQFRRRPGDYRRG